MTPDPKRWSLGSKSLAIALLVSGMALLAACAKEEPSQTAATKPARPAPTGGIGGTGFADNGVGGTGMGQERPGGIGGTGLADRRAGGIGGTGLDEERPGGIGGTGLADQRAGGIGGTGLDEERPGGIGGTGLADQRAGGIGGTGLKDWGAIGANGIGGTGIVGIVTGFGSILINSLEVQLPDTAAVQVNGAVVQPNALAAGQRVAIHVEDQAGRPTARSVAASITLEGPVQAADPATGILTVLGQRVRLAAGTPVPGGKFPIVGDSVQVSGLVRADGTLEAAAIGQGTGTARLSGTLQRRDTGWAVGNVAVEPASVAAAEALAGKAVVASGTWSGTQFQAAKVDVDPATALLERVGQVSIEGYLVAEAQQVSILVGATRLRVKLPASAGALKPGQEQLAVVSGMVAPDRSITVTAVRPLSSVLSASEVGAPKASGAAAGKPAQPERPTKVMPPGNPWGGPPASPPKGPPPGKGQGKGPPCGTPPCGGGKK
jgi:hypothetical protein